jgi:hypothetical protein
MWEPRCLTSLLASMACYRGSFTSFICINRSCIRSVVLPDWVLMAGSHLYLQAQRCGLPPLPHSSPPSAFRTQSEIVCKYAWTQSLLLGRDIAQVVSRRLSATAARVRSQVRSCGIYGGQSGSGQVFSEYFSFPCQFSFHRLLRLLLIIYHPGPV